MKNIEQQNQVLKDDAGPESQAEEWGVELAKGQ